MLDDRERHATLRVLAARRCVFFGDSITAGQYVKPEHHWTHLLESRLGADERFADVAFFVGAVSGSTSRQSLERFPQDVQARQPHVVTIQFGLNDSNRWESDRGLPRVSEQSFAANLFEMVDRARRFGALRVILSTNHPTLKPTVFDDGTPYADCARRYNEIIREVARDVHADLHDVEGCFTPYLATLSSLLLPAPDMLHLSIAGHAVYADLLEPQLRSCLEDVKAQLATRGQEFDEVRD